MSSLSHEERILSRCRDLFSGRNVTPEFAAKTCGLDSESFMVHYDAYIRRLTRAIENKQEWFLLAELEYLLRAGYMRPDEASLRFKVPQENIENWLKEKEKNEGSVSWRDMRLMRTRQGETNEKPTE
ncbi:MAG: hypothetical protein IJZ53_06375 [Tyzzerella sp.]|nr:hypothetical protein [Tyzzerella sp.]